MNIFDKVHESYFNAKRGAASRVSSKDETKKGQITCVGAEQELLTSYFGKENIWVGKVSDNKALAEKEFILDNTGEKIKLPLVCPKPDKPEELRLYMRKREGFKPDDSNYWYVYESNLKPDILHIGYRKIYDWEHITAEKPIEQLDIEDDVENEYQKILQSKLARQPVSSTTGQYPRSALVAELAVKKAHYSCEVDATHQSFISASSGKPFVEVHHLMPMGKQGGFNISLDQEANVIALCPNCHRAIHHANADTKLTLLQKLYDERSKPLFACGLNFTFEDLLIHYGLD